MGAAMGQPSNHLTYLEALAKQPFAADFFATLRRVESLFPERPRFGRAALPSDEPIRFGQNPELAFAASTLASLDLSNHKLPPRLAVNFFGLLGPNGPMPLEFTEFVRDQLMHEDNPTVARFLDMLQHRFIAFFYRAWAQAQPTVNLDRPHEDRFASYVGSLVGLGTQDLRNRDEVHDHAKYFYSGLLARQIRNCEGLAALLHGYFRIPVRIEEFVGHWMNLPISERTRLRPLGGSYKEDGAKLGMGAVLGARVWDRQHKFRIHLGPLNWQQYQAFLPGGVALNKLLSWVRLYLNQELDWDLRLVLQKSEVPPTRLGGKHGLGWGAWLGNRPRARDAEDLTLHVEDVVPLMGVRAAVAA